MLPTQRLCGTLDPGGDQVRALDLVVPDVDHAQVGVQGRLSAGGRYDELGRGADGQVWAVAAPDHLAVGLGRKEWRKASGARERPSRNATSPAGGQSGVPVGWPRIPACGRMRAECPGSLATDARKRRRDGDLPLAGTGQPRGNLCADR
ncbi:MAG: hypothetical protein OXB91_02635 [Bryobacterales bacterium]|nr:hypothetical protein [Bryobacterales bacterium]